MNTQAVHQHVHPIQEKSNGLTFMVVLWPGFLMACIACGLFFSLIDPMELIVLDERVQMHMFGAYTVGFLIFWALGSFSSYLTALLLRKIK
jgi:hypothetical protein